MKVLAEPLQEDKIRRQKLESSQSFEAIWDGRMRIHNNFVLGHHVNLRIFQSIIYLPNIQNLSTEYLVIYLANFY